MPVFKGKDLQTRQTDGVCGPAELTKLGDLGGLTQFGVTLETLAPGSRSSIKHWHAEEDELIYVLSGSVTLYEGAASTIMQSGDIATFRAGAPLGHTFENTSTEPATLLIVGTRNATETVTYPDDDRILYRKGGTYRWTDHAGAPASNPYERSQ